MIGLEMSMAIYTHYKRSVSVNNIIGVAFESESWSSSESRTKPFNMAREALFKDFGTMSFWHLSLDITL